MPNVNTPFGLKPLRDGASGYSTGGLEMFYVPSSDGTALFIGDPVVKNGSSDAAGVAGAVRAAAGGPITGVVQGFVPDGTVNMVGYRAASTAAYILVNTDLDTVYEIQDTAGTIAAADVGLNADMTLAAGSTVTKRSAVVLNAASKAATATLALKIQGLSPRPGNDFGAYAKVLVKINSSTEASASAGV